MNPVQLQLMRELITGIPAPVLRAMMQASRGVPKADLVERAVALLGKQTARTRELWFAEAEKRIKGR